MTPEDRALQIAHKLAEHMTQHPRFFQRAVEYLTAQLKEARAEAIEEALLEVGKMHVDWLSSSEMDADMVVADLRQLADRIRALASASTGGRGEGG